MSAHKCMQGVPKLLGLLLFPFTPTYTPAGTLGAHGGWSCGHSCQRCPRGARGRKGHAVHPPPRLHWPLSTPQTHPPACPPSLLHSSPAAGLPQHQLRWWSRQLKRRPRSAPVVGRAGAN
eukprot:scaffold147188_cov19-Tisochrysis_lutea.AAC.3